jgi:hypothetical protein
VRIILATLLAISTASLAQQQDAETYLNVEKARTEVQGCMKLLSSSQAIGSMPILLMSYSELDKRASELEHRGFVFRIVGTKHADDAGNEGDRYDAVIAQQMGTYLRAKGLWEDFVKQDCRIGSSQCGRK